MTTKQLALVAVLAVLGSFYLGTQYHPHHYQDITYGLAVDTSTGMMCAERAATVKPDVPECDNR